MVVWCVCRGQQTTYAKSINMLETEKNTTRKLTKKHEQLSSARFVLEISKTAQANELLVDKPMLCIVLLHDDVAERSGIWQHLVL